MKAAERILSVLPFPFFELKMQAFVTGATGFIGANLVRTLLAEGHSVRALVRRQSDRSNLHDLPIDIVEGDLNDDVSVLERLLEGRDAVFHAAALYSFYRRDRDELFRVNVEGTRRILQAALNTRVPRFVHTSSVSAIGIAPDGKTADETTETDADRLIGHYKKSKFLAEREARAAADRGLDVVIVNPSTPVGPYDIKPTPTGEIIVRFLEGRMPFYVDTGLNVIDVRDVARGHLLAWERGRKGERYILGHRNLTLKELLNLLSAVTDRPAPRIEIPHALPLAAAWVDERIVSRVLKKKRSLSVDSVKMSTEKMFYDPGKAVRELGLPQSPIEEALRAAIAWFNMRKRS